MAFREVTQLMDKHQRESKENARKQLPGTPSPSSALSNAYAKEYYYFWLWL